MISPISQSGPTELRLLDAAPELEALQKGEPASWERFFATCDGQIKSVLRWPKWRFSPDTIEELVAETHARISRGVHAFRGDCNILHFVRRTAISCCIDEVRRQARQRQHVRGVVSLEEAEGGHPALRADAATCPVRRIVRNDQARLLHQLVGELDEICQTPVREYYINERTYQEIAQRTGIAVNTLGARLNRCLRRLRELIEKRGFMHDLGLADD